MREVEVKARINSFAEVRTKLQSLGCAFSQPILQEDTIFLLSILNFNDITSGTNVLRVRKQNDYTFFTVKQPQTNELDCIEEEVVIDDPRKMAKILQLLGYKEVIKVSKRRVKTHFKEYSICLDEVENLGSFIELESLASDEDDAAHQERMFDLLIEWGVNPSDRVTIGYDTMIYRLKQGTQL